MDSATTALVVTGLSSAVGGAFVNQVCQNGADWLVSLVAAHSPAVQAKMRRNTQLFLELLATKVTVLEAEMLEVRKTVFEEALSHPSTSLLIQKAVLAAAVTDSDERHGILAELILKRMTAGGDDLVALAGSAACDAVSHISTGQIHLLGTMSLLFDVRPAKPLPVLEQVQYEEHVAKWWDLHMSKVITPDIEKVTNIDFRHLESLSCVRYSLGSFSLSTLFQLESADNKVLTSLDRIKALSWWSSFDALWKKGTHNYMTTTTGVLIGMIVGDSKRGRRTEITW